jgi:hypothetical protein
MQKKLLLFITMGCSMINADYIDELIAQYSEAFNINKAAVDKVYTGQKAENESQRTQARSHQCNGRHLLQPDENSVTGCAHAQIEAEYNNRSQINNELYQGYQTNFGFDHELERKIFIMAELYLRGLDKCGKDKACLLRHDNLKWEEMSASGFVEQQCSTVYDPVLYQGKIVLTKEQKDNLAENDPKIKELVMKLNESKQKLQDKIDLLQK